MEIIALVIIVFALFTLLFKVVAEFKQISEIQRGFIESFEMLDEESSMLRVFILQNTLREAVRNEDFETALKCKELIDEIQKRNIETVTGTSTEETN